MPKKKSKHKITRKYRPAEGFKNTLEPIPEFDGLESEDIDSDERKKSLINVGTSILAAAITGALSEAAASHATSYIFNKRNKLTATGILAGAVLGAALGIKQGLSSEDRQEREDFLYTATLVSQTANKFLFGDTQNNSSQSFTGRLNSGQQPYR